MLLPALFDPPAAAVVPACPDDDDDCATDCACCCCCAALDPGGLSMGCPFNCAAPETAADTATDKVASEPTPAEEAAAGVETAAACEPEDDMRLSVSFIPLVCCCDCCGCPEAAAEEAETAACTWSL